MNIRSVALALVFAGAHCSAFAAPTSIVGEGMVWFGDYGRGIYTFDPNSGAVVKRLDVNVGSSVINDLAFDRNSGLLYGVSGGALYGTSNTLFTIDLTTPALTTRLLGTLLIPDSIGTSAVTGLAFSGGQLYAAERIGSGNTTLADKLFTVDLTTLSFANVVGLGAPANYNVGDLASDGADGPLFSLQTLPVNVFTVNPLSGTTTLLGRPATTNFQYGLSYSASRQAFFSGGTDGAIWRLDANTFAAQQVGTSLNSAAIAGMEYVTLPAVPEPGSWLLLGCGLAALAFRRASCGAQPDKALRS